MKIQDAITYQDKLNELRLDISHPKSKGKVFVLLEGESDVRLFRKLFHIDNCKVENIPGGNSKLEECVQSLTANYPSVIGIRDADFIILNNVAYQIPKVFLTDSHDIEMVMFSTDELFSSLMSEHTRLSKDQHLPARDKILTTINQIGYLKWLNERENLEYTFKIGFNDLLSFINEDINIVEYFTRLLTKSPRAKNTDIADVLKKIVLLQQLNPDQFQLCNGHDFLTAFSQYLRQVHNANDIDEKSIASSCRIFYTFNYYQNTTLYQNTKKWADDNNYIIY